MSGDSACPDSELVLKSDSHRNQSKGIKFCRLVMRYTNVSSQTVLVCRFIAFALPFPLACFTSCLLLLSFLCFSLKHG